MKVKNLGFTLIELMVVVAIIGVLAAVAVPSYGNYTKRAKYADVITQASTYKVAVGLCIQDRNEIDGCNNGVGTIAAAITSPVGNTASLTVVDGSITAIGTKQVDDAVYKLDPIYNASNNTLSWKHDTSMAKTCINNRLCMQVN